jgi:hypothetical protein
MTYMVCTDVCSQTVRKSYYKEQQRIKLFVWKLHNSMHATYEPLFKKNNSSAVRDNLSLLPKILLYHGLRFLCLMKKHYTIWVLHNTHLSGSGEVDICHI